MENSIGGSLVILGTRMLSAVQRTRMAGSSLAERCHRAVLDTKRVGSVKITQKMHLKLKKRKLLCAAGTGAVTDMVLTGTGLGARSWNKSLSGWM
jgi:hypothetical protein